MEPVSSTSSSRGRVEGSGPRNALDRMLGVFADVRPGEGLTAVLLMTNVFLLLCGYYLLKTIREPLVLSSPGGAEAKSYSAAAIAGLLAIIVPLYSWLAARLPRVRLINGVTLFFITCLAAFSFLQRSGVPIGVPFFIWVGIFNMVIVAQFWGFAADVYTVEQGKRLFAIVGVGASSGAILGSFITGNLVKAVGPYPFLIAAAVVLAVCMLLTNIVDRREAHNTHAAPETERREHPADEDKKAPEAGAGRNGFALVFTNRYLLLIALLVLLQEVVKTNGEYIMGKSIINAYRAAHGATALGGLDEQKVIGQFYGNFFTLVNVVSAIFQAFFVSRIIKYWGVRVALWFLPVVTLGGYLSLAFLPVLPLVRGVKVAENSLDYSLQNTARNALYLPTSREAKYKAKQATDSFFVRFADVISAGFVFAGTTWLGFQPRHLAMVNVGLIALWLVVVVLVGRRFHGLTRTA